MPVKHKSKCRDFETRLLNEQGEQAEICRGRSPVHALKENTMNVYFLQSPVLRSSALLGESQTRDIPVRENTSGCTGMALKKDAWEMSWTALKGEIAFQSATGAQHS